MNVEKGRIFWDLPPQVDYVPGSDLACAFYVVNPASYVMRYSLNADLFYKAFVIERQTVPVNGLDSFAVDPGDFITVRGTLRFGETNAELHVALVDADTGEICDTVSTNLVQAGAVTAYTPSPVRITADVTWIIVPIAVLGLLGTVMTRAARELQR